MIFIVIGICIFILLWNHCRQSFKIGYYETKLKNRDIDIEKVKNMPFYKLWMG